MSSRTLHELAIAAIALAGALALSLIDASSPVPLAAAGVVLLLTWRTLAGRPPLLGPLLSNLGSLLLLALLGADYWLLGKDPLLALAHFVLKLQLLKLCSVRRPRDSVLFCVMGLLLLGLASLLLYQLDFVLLLVSYGGLIPLALLTSHQLAWHERRRQRTGEGEAGGPRLGLGFVTFAGLLGGAVMALTCLVFVCLPRLGDSAVRLSPFGISRSGLADRIDLNRAGSIERSQRVVMRVRLAGPTAPRPLYFRALTLDRYENGRWTRGRVGWWRRRDLRIGEALRVGWRPPGVELLEQTTIFEPGQDKVLPVIGLPITLELRSGISDAELRRDDAGRMLLEGRRGKQVMVKLECWVRQTLDPRASRMRWSRLRSREAQRRYTQLPPGFDRARFRALAGEIRRQAGARTIVERARAIESYLRREPFRYTLERAPLSAGVDPLTAFCFDHRRGHCELFAGTMVALLRSEGLPARVVGGYLAGEHNAVGDYVVVRESHAHAWVELYIPGADWVRFDPTPAAIAPPEPPASDWRATRDYLRLLWITEVVAFDGADQRETLRGLGERLRSLARWRRRGAGDADPDAPSSAASWALPSPWLALALLALALLWLRRRRAAARRQRPHPLHPLLERLLRALRRRQLVREPGETLSTFAARVEGAGQAASAAWLRRYRDLRYQPQPAAKAIAALRASLPAPG